MTVVGAIVESAGATWSWAALLAGASALALALIKFGVEYSKDASWQMARPILSKHRGRVFWVLLLEAATGVATAGLVVLLGITQPAWIDEPLGWVLVGLAASGVATASLGTLPIGRDGIKVGLAAAYSPLRQMLLVPIDNAFHQIAIAYRNVVEPIFRRRVLAALDQGDLDVPAMIAALDSYASRSVRSDGEKQAIQSQITELTSRSIPSGVNANAWERDKAGQLTAFMVENRYLSVLESLVGKLDEQELTGLEPPAPPPGAIGLPS